MKLSSLYRKTNSVTEIVQNNKEKRIFNDNRAELILVAAEETQPDCSRIDFNLASKDALKPASLPLIQISKNQATQVSQPIRPTIDTGLSIGNEQNNSRDFFPELNRRSEDRFDSNEKSGSDNRSKSDGKSDSNDKSGSDGKSDFNEKLGSDGKSGSDNRSKSDGKSDSNDKSGSDGKSGFNEKLGSDGKSGSDNRSKSDGKSDSNDKSGSSGKTDSNGKPVSSDNSGSDRQLSSEDKTNSENRSELASDAKQNPGGGLTFTEPRINENPDISFNTGDVRDPRIELAPNGGTSLPQVEPSIIALENIPTKDPVSIISSESPGSNVPNNIPQSDSLSPDSQPTLKGITPSIDVNNGLQNPSIDTIEEISTNIPQPTSLITSPEKLAGQDELTTALPEENTNRDPTILIDISDTSDEYEENENKLSGNPGSLPIKSDSSSDNRPKISAQQNGQRSGSEIAIIATASIIGILVFFTAVACIARFFIRKRRKARSDISPLTPLINRDDSISLEKSGSLSPDIPRIYSRQENTIFHDEERLREEDMKKSYGRF